MTVLAYWKLSTEMRIVMSRGNINRRYLRRRKNWFQRNWGYLSAALLLVVLLVAGVFAGLYFYRQYQESSGQNQNRNSIQNVPQESTEQEKPVTWIDNKEPQPESAAVYVPPAGVQYPYFIRVNRAMNCVTVYGTDSQNVYTIPVKAFACSVGRAGEETITGENYKTSDKYEWRLMVDNSYGMYANRISGGYLFHSVPYYMASHDSLETAEFNKLGTAASLGCIRMCVRDVKWIYDNCPQGTGVTIYDDMTSPGPLGKPEMIKIPTTSPYAGWDPTDPSPDNPWKNNRAQIKGAKDITVKAGESADLLKGVTAADTCGNDITKDILVIGRYTFDLAGDYDIRYVVTDLLGSRAEQSVKLHVTKQAE